MAEVVPGFLAASELADLCRLAHAAAAESWQLGRQGTGYEILSIRDAALPCIARALVLLGTPYQQYWDAYLLRYRDGAHVPAHIDPAQHGRRHRRLNAMLVQAAGGGELHVDGALVELGVGDAVVFFPDRERHEVAPVIGTRLLFSVGAWI